MANLSHIQQAKVLIVVSGYSSAGVGEQYIKSMLANREQTNTWRYSPVVTEGIVPSEQNTTVRKVAFHRLPGLSHIALRHFQQKELAQCVQEVKDIVTQHDIDVLWVFLNSWYSIQIASQLSEHLTIPMVAHVWDTPEYLASKLRTTARYKADLMNAFDTVMKTAARAVTVSEAMTTEYMARYSVESTPMVLCPPVSTWQDPLLQQGETIRLIFAGSLYAFKQWNAMLDAVEHNNKQEHRKRISVTCIGNVSRRLRKRKWVDYLPIMAPEEAAKMVNEADIAYLPYWMSASHAYFVNMAFPGKMSFYTVAGTPILYHGPKESTPTSFLEKYKVGLSCHTNEVTDICDAIQAITETDFLTHYKMHRSKAIEEVFHPQNCIDIFNSTLAKALHLSTFTK